MCFPGCIWEWPPCGATKQKDDSQRISLWCIGPCSMRLLKFNWPLKGYLPTYQFQFWVQCSGGRSFGGLGSTRLGHYPLMNSVVNSLKRWKPQEESAIASPLISTFLPIRMKL